MRPNIMFVDNSISVLESLLWLFNDEPYYLFAFDNPIDALSVINTLDWAVIVTDRYMEKMDGPEFLKKVRENSPHTVGIIMTGYTETAEVLEKLYPGCIYEFVKKPLDNIEIKRVVKAAVTRYKENVGTSEQNILKLKKA